MPKLGAETARSLGTMKAKESITHLIKLLDDKNIDVKCCSVMPLGYMEDKSVIPQLVKFLDHTNEDVRACVCLSRGNRRQKCYPVLTKSNA
jgi:HEAT repeat protein